LPPYGRPNKAGHTVQAGSLENERSGAEEPCRNVQQFKRTDAKIRKKTQVSGRPAFLSYSPYELDTDGLSKFVLYADHMDAFLQGLNINYL
jgi:hypothetical protein